MEFSKKLEIENYRGARNQYLGVRKRYVRNCPKPMQGLRQMPGHYLIGSFMKLARQWSNPCGRKDMQNL